jgi:tellurite methyltransferase
LTKITCLSIGVFLLFFFWSNRWKKYYQEKMSHPPRQFVIDALKEIPKSREVKIALDLGSGVGHETLLLLQEGYQVIAVDSQKIAFNVMLQRPEFEQYKTKLKTIVSPFEKLGFEQLPDFDLIVASFSLPFVSPDHFDYVFSHIMQKLKSEGYFIGNFFDPGFTSFAADDRKNMTFHSKDQVKDLFKEFTVLRFKEEKSQDKNTGAINHFYIVFAQKKS